jgi:acetyltransferase-like isoleucine patch superfamily enzyme
MSREIVSQEIPVKMARGKLFAERPATVFLTAFRGKVNKIGAFSYGNIDTIVYSADIGRYCSMGQRVLVAPFEHPTDWLSSHPFAFGIDDQFQYAPEYNEILSPEQFEPNFRRTKIGNDVWIGAGAFIRRGVTIGDGAIIAANATVVSDVPPYHIVGGTPARTIRQRFDDKLIEKFLAVKWWDYRLLRSQLGQIAYANPAKALEQIEEQILSGSLERFNPEVLVFKNGKLLSVAE